MKNIKMLATKSCVPFFLMFCLVIVSIKIYFQFIERSRFTSVKDYEEVNNFFYVP